MGKLLPNTEEDIEKIMFLTPTHLCFRSALTQNGASLFGLKEEAD